MRATCLGDLQSGDLESSDLDDSYGLRFLSCMRHHRHRITRPAGQRRVASDATGKVCSRWACTRPSDRGLLDAGLAFTYDQTDVTSGNGLGKSEGKSYGVDAYIAYLFDEEQRWFVAGDLGVAKSTYMASARASRRPT